MLRWSLLFAALTTCALSGVARGDTLENLYAADSQCSNSPDTSGAPRDTANCGSKFVSVYLKDNLGNPKSGVTVTFGCDTGGWPQGNTQTTGGDGKATRPWATVWPPGQVVEGPYQVHFTASAPGATTVDYYSNVGHWTCTAAVLDGSLANASGATSDVVYTPGGTDSRTGHVRVTATWEPANGEGATLGRVWIYGESNAHLVVTYHGTTGLGMICVTDAYVAGSGTPPGFRTTTAHVQWDSTTKVTPKHDPSETGSYTAGKLYDVSNNGQYKDVWASSISEISSVGSGIDAAETWGHALVKWDW